VLGVETECRIGNAVYPNHYDVGWHIIGAAGVFGSAAAVGKTVEPQRTADGLGAWPGGVGASGVARVFRLDEQELRPWASRQQRHLRSNASVEELLAQQVLPVVTPGIDPAQVDMTIVLKDGRTLHRFIAHAIGSAEVPMTDKQFEDKFADLADGIIPASSIQRVMDACWNVESLTNAAEIAKMSVSA
jgi:hypothetical protein